jgi:pimeloyl-ACP methyl ester carboxylesterase
MSFSDDYPVFIEVNGIRLAYSDSGSGEQVALLVHGFPLNRSMWDPQIGHLRAAGLRVIAPDLRGFGASEPGPPGPLTMDQHADDLAALLDALGIAQPVAFIGLSMGGYIGFAFWRRHRTRVRALALLDTRASPDSAQGQAERHRLAAEVEATSSAQPAIETMLPRFFSPHLRAGSPLEQQVVAMMAGTQPRGVADGARGLASRSESYSTLATIDVPTLVVVGEYDALTPPADAEAIAAGVPGARLVRVAEAGHMSNLENPDEVNQALGDWLKQALARPAGSPTAA